MAIVLIHYSEGFSSIKKPLAGSDLLLVLAGGEGRVAAGTKLFLAEGFPRVALTNDGVISRWSKKHGRNLSNVEWSEEELISAGIPAEAIVKLPFSHSGTIYDALHARDFVLAEGIKSFTIVTSDYHARRALWTFEKVFEGESVKIALYPVLEVNPDEGVVAGYMCRSMTLLMEGLKSLYYRIRFGLLPRELLLNLQSAT
jgi:uncharacterized SAM-binding protein YcdF (DUF218 family)